MRGGQCDAMQGAVERPLPSLVPHDTLSGNVTLLRPFVAMNTETTNRQYELTKRRTFGIQVANYPQMPGIALDPRKPSTLQNNGFAPLPNAGIYRKKQYYIGGVVVK